MDNVYTVALFSQWIYRQLSASNKISMCPHFRIADDFTGTRLFIVGKLFLSPRLKSVRNCEIQPSCSCVQSAWGGNLMAQASKLAVLFVTKRKAIKYLMKKGPRISIHLGIVSIFWYICENWVPLLQIIAHCTSCLFAQLQMGKPQQQPLKPLNTQHYMTF